MAVYSRTITETPSFDESLTGARDLTDPKASPNIGDTTETVEGSNTLTFTWSNIDHAFKFDGSTDSVFVTVNDPSFDEVTWGEWNEGLKPSDEDCGEWVPDEVNSSLFGIELSYEVSSTGMTAAGFGGSDPNEVLSRVEIEDVYLEVFYEENFTFGEVKEFGDSFISVTRDGPKVIAVGAQGQVFRETDPETNSWEDISPNTHEFAEDILSIQYNRQTGEYLLSGKNGFVATSSDNGDSWVRKSSFRSNQHLTKMLPASSQLVATGSNRLGLVGADLDSLKNAVEFTSPYGIIIPCVDDFLADPTFHSVNFNDGRYERGSAMSGIVDSKEFTLSFWIQPTSAVYSVNSLEGVESDQFRAHLESGSFNPEFSAKNGATRVLRVYPDTDGGTVDAWNHWFITIDLTSTSRRAIYKNGSDISGSVTWDTYTDSLMTFTNPSTWTVGNDIDFTSNDCLMGEVWFDTQYLDPATYFSSFYGDGTFRNVDLGTNGENITGTSPLVCLNKETDNWNQNAGTGGDFTLIT